MLKTILAVLLALAIFQVFGPTGIVVILGIIVLYWIVRTTVEDYFVWKEKHHRSP